LYFQAPENALLWEERFLKIMERLQKELNGDGFAVYYAAGRSYGDVSAEAMFQDMDKLSIGVTMMFIFMQLVLSKFSWVEIRLILGLMGLLSVGMAFVAGAGLCSFLGVSYGPVHTSLPFLLMGLGVDDMFVMMAGWRKVQSTHSDLALPEKMGMMLRHAGTSITVTSLTDIVAFVVGATTVSYLFQLYKCTTE
jgi:Niemann-Pick C1 protein